MGPSVLALILLCSSTLGSACKDGSCPDSRIAIAYQLCVKNNTIQLTNFSVPVMVCICSAVVLDNVESTQELIYSPSDTSKASRSWLTFTEDTLPITPPLENNRAKAMTQYCINSALNFPSTGFKSVNFSWSDRFYWQGKLVYQENHGCILKFPPTASTTSPPPSTTKAADTTVFTKTTPKVTTKSSTTSVSPTTTTKPSTSTESHEKSSSTIIFIHAIHIIAMIAFAHSLVVRFN